MGEPGHVSPNGEFGCYLTDRCSTVIFTCLQEEDHEWGNLAMSHQMESLGVTLLTGVQPLFLPVYRRKTMSGGTWPCLTKWRVWVLSY